MVSKSVAGSSKKDSETRKSQNGVEPGCISLRGVRVHNLDEVDLDIPHGQWLAICGRSGSGKTSLAFDTLFAEGQRRYVESFSPFARQFLQQLDKPDAESIDGIPPAIGFRAGNNLTAHGTTVGTASEINDHLQLLFANYSVPICADCKVEGKRHTPSTIAAWVAEFESGTRFQIGFTHRVEDQDLNWLAKELNGAGYVRAIIGNQTVRLNEYSGDRSFDQIIVLVDRLTVDDSNSKRLMESLDNALKQESKAVVLIENQLDRGQPVEIDGRTWTKFEFSSEPICSSCSRIFPDPLPALFNFSHQLGACDSCNGTGWAKAGDKRSDLCTRCHGLRFNETSRAFKLQGQSISDVCQMSIDDASQWFESVVTTMSVDNSLTGQLASRLSYLSKVGLGYLSFERRAQTLSSGEYQRINLASALGTTLINMLYVLDEPSVGLHPANLEKLKSVICDLHQRGNTVVIVDHEPDLIQASERIVEIGPGQGREGGRVVFDGDCDSILENDQSLTGQYLAGKRGVPSGGNRRQPRGFIKLTGASGNNLKNINVEFPLGVLCAVAGVSGSGKSTLLRETLFPAINAQLEEKDTDTLPFDTLRGTGSIGQVVMVDQALPAKTSRSNPITYIKAFDEIRNLFAQTIDAKTRGLKPGHFSFNVDGGRCEKCKGDGYLRIDMQFLADALIRCDHCHGQRFKKDVLTIKYRNRSIADVLDLTVQEAFLFFRGQPKIQNRLKFLKDVGLSYVTLGQPLSTLSTGERQRIKLAHHLGRSSKQRTLLLMDEPTIGLHMADVVQLLDCFAALLAVGHSLIVIEHNMQFLEHADHIIDLGPGAGDNGGEIVAEGTPEQIIANQSSITGRYLAEWIHE